MRACALWMGLVAAAILLGGCDKGSPDEQRAENRRLLAQVIALAKEVSDLKGQVSDAGRDLAAEMAVTASLAREMVQVRAEDETVKADYAQMKIAYAQVKLAYAQVKKDYDRLQADSGRADPEPASTARAPGAKTPKVIRVRSKEDEARIRELDMQEADVKARIAQTQATIGLTRTKISSLTRATVDAKAEVPPTMFGNRSGMFGTGQEGYVVRGAYSSVQEKDAALNAVKAKLAPLFIDLRAFQSELAAVRKELVDLRSSDP